MLDVRLPVSEYFQQQARVCLEDMLAHKELLHLKPYGDLLNALGYVVEHGYITMQYYKEIKKHEWYTYSDILMPCETELRSLNYELISASLERLRFGEPTIDYTPAQSFIPTFSG